MLSMEELKEQVVFNHLIKYKTINEDELFQVLIDNGLIKEPVCNNTINKSLYNLMLNLRKKGIKLAEQMNPFIVSEDAVNFSAKLYSPLYDAYGEKIGMIILHPKYYRSELI